MDPFVWDEAKNAENHAKHGIGFDVVYQIDWSSVVYDDDKRFDYGEHRVRAVGRLDGVPY